MLSVIIIAVLGVAIFIFCLWWLDLRDYSSTNVYGSRREHRDADARAKRALSEMLSLEEYDQLTHRGYIEVRSPSTPQRVYRIPNGHGRVAVYDSGKRVMGLCVGPVEYVPDADLVLVHKLMIEANEAEYLKLANRF